MNNVDLNAKKQEALDFHKKNNKPGKVSLLPTKPLLTQGDLSLAYSPGVAEPCIEIEKDPNKIYDYTAKGSYVAVISNGTAVLGLGNIGPLASKPVMEGKAVLFKRFADIDAVDIEVDTEDVENFVNAVRYLGPSWGGINLEDIKSPECFLIEKRLNELMDIPVFHDDQHGTAIVVAASIINAAHITKRELKDIKVVINGAGAAGIACTEMLKLIGIKSNNIILCDQHGVIYKGRSEMNEWKEKYAINTSCRSLKDALDGADAFLGLSVANVLTEDMLTGMNKNPIIFALANPDPEIKPELARKARPDAIIATGRSDYPNQINNVMGFPYIFRGALDVQAKAINDEMKIAAAYAIAELAKEPVLYEVSVAYGGKKMSYGPDYIVPTPFDPRLISTISPAVAKAAIDSGVARKEIKDWGEYKKQLRSLLSPTFNTLNLLYEYVKLNPKKVIFSEGEEEIVIRTAVEWRNSGYGESILVGRSDKIIENMKGLGIENTSGIKIMNAAISECNDVYIDYMYKKLQRFGYLHRSCVRAVKTDRNIFSACMLACGEGDILITGLTRDYTSSLNDVQKIVGFSNNIVFGLSIVITKDRTLFIADTAINETLTEKELAEVAIKSAAKAKQMGHKPRVAFISFSTFGSHWIKNGVEKIHKAIEILDNSNVDFEYDGELSVDAALNQDILSLYPFCRLSGSANILIMPGLHSASISSKLLQEVGGGSTVGPILIGMEKPVQIVQMTSSVSEILNLAILAAADIK